MIRPKSARERRLLALFFLIALAATIWFAVLSPIANGFAARAEKRELLTLRYVHNQRIIDSIPRLRRETEAQRAATRDYAISAANPEAGRDWLKERAQRVIEHVGGEFREATDAEGRPGGVVARISARMTLPKLTAALGQLQNTPPWLVVEMLSVSANDALVTGQPSSMDVQLEISIPLRATATR